MSRAKVVARLGQRAVAGPTTTQHGRVGHFGKKASTHQVRAMMVDRRERAASVRRSRRWRRQRMALLLSRALEFGEEMEATEEEEFSLTTEDNRREKNPPPARTVVEEETSPRLLEVAFVEEGGRWVRSSKKSWRRLWASKPLAVGIDAEGTHLQPPLLVQISFGDEVILEAPREDTLSPNLTKLLADAQVAKIFFGPPSNENFGSGVEMKNCLDVQKLAVDAMAPGDVDRGRLPGLADVATRALDGGPFAKNRKVQKQFFNFRRRPHTLDWLNDDALALYSAADAWATLRVYLSLFHPKQVVPPQDTCSPWWGAFVHTFKRRCLALFSS